MDKKTDKTTTKAKTGAFTSFVEGETITGKFLRVKETQIIDRISKQPKVIRIYKILLADGSTSSIGGRTMLDDAFDDVCALKGGWESMIGKEVIFTRGEDVELDDDTTNEVKHLGTYTVVFK